MSAQYDSELAQDNKESFIVLKLTVTFLSTTSVTARGNPHLTYCYFLNHQVIVYVFL